MASLPTVLSPVKHLFQDVYHIRPSFGFLGVYLLTFWVSADATLKAARLPSCPGFRKSEVRQNEFHAPN
jgi:hypothetical protein